MSAPFISFIIPVRDDASRLRRCLERIRVNIYPRERIEVIVVDNGSIDGSCEVARAAGASVLCISHVHVAELRNRGANVARGDILAFVDADHEIDVAWAASAAETLSGPGVGAVGALYHAPPDGTWVQRTYDMLRARTPGCRDANWLGSGNLAVRADAFHRLGGFDRTLETCEDVDLCQRLRAEGYRVMSNDRLRSVHLGDPPTLRALFFSELWRGRDNLRTSLRGPFSWRGLPSIAIPVVDLGGLALGALGLLAAPLGGLAITAASLAAIAGLASLRTARMLACGSTVAPARALQSFVVACVYDVARAVALVWPASHRMRQAADNRGYRAI
jgi:GT2 family glycosyltransferase